MRVASLQNDFDMIDYLNELREACLEAYTGIVQGLKGTGETPNRKYTCTSSPHCLTATPVTLLNRTLRIGDVSGKTSLCVSDVICL